MANEKLIELIREIDGRIVVFAGMSFDEQKECLYSQLADHLLANGVTFVEDNNVPSKWISVKEQLPKPGERVLVCVGAVFEAFIDDRGKWQRYYSAPLNDVLGEPTHWMHLPQPPKGE